MWVVGWRQSSFTSPFKSRETTGPIVELPVNVERDANLSWKPGLTMSTDCTSALPKNIRF